MATRKKVPKKSGKVTSPKETITLSLNTDFAGRLLRMALAADPKGFYDGANIQSMAKQFQEQTKV